MSDEHRTAARGSHLGSGADRVRAAAALHHGLALADGGPGTILNGFGADVVIEIRDRSVLSAPSLDLRARGDLGVLSTSNPFDVPGEVSLCAGPQCAAFGEPDSTFGYEGDYTFTLILTGPLTSRLGVFTTGNLDVVYLPDLSIPRVPEPGTGLLVGLGLCMSAVARKRG